MISITALTSRIQEELNNLDEQLQFVVHTDTSEYQQAIRVTPNKRDDYINGLAEVTSSENVPTQTGINVSSLSLKIEFVYKCQPTPKARTIESDTGVIASVEGNETRTKKVHDVLDAFCAKQYEEVIEDKNIFYTVTELFSLTNTGTRGIRPIVGDSMTFVLYGTIYVVENGESSTGDVFILDGQIIPYIRHTVNRKTINQTDVHSGESVAKTTAQGSSVQFNFSLPSVLSALNDAIKKYMLDGESKVIHILEFIAGKWANGQTASRLYLVQFDSQSRVGEGTKIAGLEIMLVESWDDNEMMTFPDTYTATEILAAATQKVYCSQPAYGAILYDGEITAFKVDTKNGNYYETAAALTLPQGAFLQGTAELLLTPPVEE